MLRVNNIPGQAASRSWEKSLRAILIGSALCLGSGLYAAEDAIDPDAGFDDIRHNTAAATTASAPVSLSTDSQRSMVSAGFSQAGGTSEANRPWSGIWWPRKSAGLVYHEYSDGLSPMEKYDTIFYNVTKRVAGAASWEADPMNRHNYAPYSDKPSWTGHCNGLAAAAILEPQPKSSLRFNFGSSAGKIVLKYQTASTAPYGFSQDGKSDYYLYAMGANGMLLTVADQKGWLSELYQSTNQLSFANANYSGNRYYDSTVRPSDAAYKDIIPHYFHYLLLNYVKAGRAIVIDASTGSSVFNYPLFYFTSRSTYYPAYRTHSVRTTVYLTDYASDGNYVGTKIKTKDYTYQMTVDTAGRITSSQWTGSSINDHPDFAWIPVSRAGPSGTRSNPNLDHARIKGWIKNSQSPMQTTYSFQ